MSAALQIFCDSPTPTHVVRFVPDIFVRFAGFEGEYHGYLTEKRVNRAKTDGAKMAARVGAGESDVIS